MHGWLLSSVRSAALTIVTDTPGTAPAPGPDPSTRPVPGPVTVCPWEGMAGALDLEVGEEFGDGLAAVIDFVEDFLGECGIDHATGLEEL